jgi:hypothetical protein
MFARRLQRLFDRIELRRLEVDGSKRREVDWTLLVFYPDREIISLTRSSLGSPDGHWESGKSNRYFDVSENLIKKVN